MSVSQGSLCVMIHITPLSKYPGKTHVNMLNLGLIQDPKLRATGKSERAPNCQD